jgi:hypothetical protein
MCRRGQSGRIVEWVVEKEWKKYFFKWYGEVFLYHVAVSASCLVITYRLGIIYSALT